MIAHSISSLTAGVTSPALPAAMPFKVPQSLTAAQQQPSPLTDSDSGCSTPELDVDVVSCTPAPTSSSASSSSSSRSPLTEKKYCCQRCLNHGEEWPRKGHKPLCKWSKCRCDACMMVEHRRQLNSQLSQRKSDPNLPKSQCGKKIRDPKCARCGAHGQTNALRGHKKSNCPYSTCACDKCDLVEMRRMLMAKQIKLRRDQQKERKAQQEQGVQIEYELARQQRGAANDGKSMFFAAFSQPTGMVNNNVLTNVSMPAAMNFIGFQRPNMMFTQAQVAALQNSAVNGAVKNALGLSLISPSAQTMSEIQQSTSPVMTTPLGSINADARATPELTAGIA
ncbi:DM DNA binding domain containing protein [Aphelenchoides avenae]|nr:DM DNA binding domain containing protein [Aphelenchus avenae]